MVMLDSSTTCLTIAEAILALDLTVTLITNSLAICNLFADRNSNVNLVGIGGVFRRRTSSFADPNTVEALHHFYADKVFISCPKLSAEQGLSDNHISEANVRRQMLKSAKMKILVVDHTKFEGTANHLFEGLENVDLVITDQRVPESFEAFAARRQIQIQITPD